MLSFALVSIVFVLSLIWFVFHRRRQSNGATKIPGIAASHPERGNLDDIGRAGSLHQFLTQLHRQFGPVASFHWGELPVVSIASPSAFQDTRRLFDRPVPLFAAFEPLIGAHSIQYANGDDGRYRRKNHYDAALSPVALRDHFFDIFQSVLREKLLGWRTNDGQQPIGLHAEMCSMAIRSITLTAFGASAAFHDEKRIEHAYNTCWHEMEMRIQGQPVDVQRALEFDQARAYFLEQVKATIAERRQRSGEADKCFIDYLLNDEEHVRSDEHIGDEVMTMFVGGFHTTGNLLTWTLYYLAKYQHVQERLADELVRTCTSEFPTFEQIEQMPYLSSVINESLRLSVLAPWAARVSSDESIAVGGYQIPAGTPMIQALGVLMHDETIWANPKEFDPDRFDPERKKSLPAFAFSPFGFAGKRVCPGYRFAQYEASAFLSGIIRTFKVTLEDPQRPVVPVHGLVTAPNDEIWVRFQARTT